MFCTKQVHDVNVYVSEQVHKYMSKEVHKCKRRPYFHKLIISKLGTSA